MGTQKDMMESSELKVPEVKYPYKHGSRSLWDVFNCFYSKNICRLSMIKFLFVHTTI